MVNLIANKQASKGRIRALAPERGCVEDQPQQLANQPAEICLMPQSLACAAAGACHTAALVRGRWAVRGCAQHAGQLRARGQMPRTDNPVETVSLKPRSGLGNNFP